MATHESSGKAAARKNAARAAYMKSHGIERTTARCGGCYATVTRETWKSRYTHYCWSR